MKSQACCFYGASPRIIHYGYNEQHPDCLRLKMLLAAEIEIMVKRGVTSFLTGMVQGVDIWCAEIVLGLKAQGIYKGIRLIACLPYEEQAAHWNEEIRERYFNILAEADDEVTLQTRYSSDCMYKHKRHLVDLSSYLIAVHDGRNDLSQYMINYARQKGLYILSIHPDTLEKHYHYSFHKTE